MPMHPDLLLEDGDDPNFVAVLELVEKLEVFQFYPKKEKAVKAYAAAVCRIIQDQEKCPALESCRRLINRALSDCEKFPAPVELYNLYYSIGFKPKDQGPVPERFIEWKRN